MPDRILRDELMRSARYRRLTSDTARLLFVHLVLTVDSLGNTEADTTAIEDVLHRPLGDETVAKLLSELADVDLIRMYQNSGKRYLHIPRFRQRLRYLQGKHPLPPPQIECIEMKELREKVGLQSDRSQSTVRRSEVKRSEVIRSNSLSGLATPDRKRATRMPEDWQLPAEWRDWAIKAYHLDHAKVVRISLKFRDHWYSLPPAKATHADWFATWRNWIRREMADV